MEAVLGILKALADGNRLRVVMALTAHKELCVCYLAQMLGISMATVSRHMSILQAAGVVTSRKEGRWVYYRLRDDFPPVLRKWLTVSLAGGIGKDRELLASLLRCGWKPGMAGRLGRPAAKERMPGA